MLHKEKEVHMRQRYTLDQTNSNIPKWKNPEAVTDVVLMVGLNDSRGDETVETTLQKQKVAFQRYSDEFKNAKIHIESVAPFTEKQKTLNQKIREYSESAGISFIDNKGLFDRDTGAVRPNMLKGYHYTETATKIIAKEIKRNLYAINPRQLNLLTNHGRYPTNHGRSISVTQERTKNPSQGLMNAMEGFFRKAEMMLGHQE
jgi:hypothetical protein